LARSQPVNSGERNEDVRRFAIREAVRSGPDVDNEMEQQDLLLKVRMVNTVQCKPPMDDDEVVAIFRSAIAFVRKTRSAGMRQDAAIEQDESQTKEVATTKRVSKPATVVRVFTETGLSFAPLVPDSDSEPEWGPGEWRLTCVHSDPLEYRLHVPAWRKWTQNGSGDVSLTVDQFRSATKVAAAVLAATGVVMLDDEPKRWRLAWDGGYRVADNTGGQNPKKRTARGVKAKLLDNVAHEWPGASSLRYVLLAGWLYDRLSQASQPADDDIPDPTGRAAWRQDGSLWFSWGKVWEDIERQHRINEGERLAFKRRLLATTGDDDFTHSEFKHIGGTRKSYVVWGKAEFAALDRLANESANPPTM
jgi:hypothetical protein